MSKTQVKFQIAKQTKRTYVFKELDDQGVPIDSPMDPRCKVGQLYVKQSVFNGQRPDKITVTIEEG